MNQKDKIVHLENRIVELEQKKTYNLPIIEIIFLLLFLSLAVINIQNISEDLNYLGNNKGIAPKLKDISYLYPPIMEYIFIGMSVLCFVVIIKGGCSKVYLYNPDGLIIGLIGGLIVGLIIGLIGGLITYFVFGLMTSSIFSLTVYLTFGFTIGLVVGLIYGLVIGLDNEFNEGD